MTARTPVRVLERADIFAAAASVPTIVDFPPIDELTAWFDDLEERYPTEVASRRIGTSRLGEPLRCVTIGTGATDIVIVGGVHPNEPIGFRTVQHLACIDPDGARLNEGWFANPTDRRHYARGFYRPAPDEQVEWTFPTSYGDAYFDRVLPETMALMRLLDDVQPALYTSLHNGEMGGVYYYLSRADADLTEVLLALPAHVGLPLDRGEPEAPYLEVYAPAVYGTGTIADAYDYLEALGVEPGAQIGGSSSSEYVARYGTLALVAELPYWIHPDAGDATPSTETYRAVLERTATAMARSMSSLADLLERAEPHLRIDTPFLRASRAFVPALAAMAETDMTRAADPSALRPATVAERFSCADIVTCFRMRYGGMLVRALRAEATAGTATAPLRRLAEDAQALYDGWLAERGPGDDAVPAPIEALVGIQYGAILAAAASVCGAGEAVDAR
jgi:Zinc carboxypeptidase